MPRFAPTHVVGEAVLRGLAVQADGGSRDVVLVLLAISPM